MGGKLIRQPGRAVFGKHPSPKAGTLKLAGDKVIEFPKLPEMPVVTLKVPRREERVKRRGS